MQKINRNAKRATSGRPLVEDVPAVQELLEQGLSRRRIAETLSLSEDRVKRIKQLLDEAASVTARDKDEVASSSEGNDLKERIATAELTVPYSNWIGQGWVRECADPQEVYETDEDGEQLLAGVKLDPGVLWPEEWDGAKTLDEIWISPSVPAPRSSLKAGYLLTGMQDKTPAHGPLLINMVAFAQARGYEYIEAGVFTYGKGLFASGRKKDLVQVADWSSLLTDIVTRSRRHLAKNVQTCFEMNMSPTKSNPLTGLNSYVRGKTSIFAHPRRAVQSVPRPQSSDPVTLWTTGACTVPNYVLREAGLKALQRHTIGFLIVEVDDQDRVYIRNVDADPETGNFFDLDLFVSGGNVFTVDEVIEASEGRVDRPFLGIPCTHRKDIHLPYARAYWGYGGSPEDDVPLIDLAKPRGQAFNDLLDGKAINHHEDKTPILVYKRHARQDQHLEAELKQAADFLIETSRPFCKTYVTYSNHDDFVARWLQRPSTEIAVENQKLWHLANFQWREAIDKGEKFDVFEWLLRRANSNAAFEIVNADMPLDVYGVRYEFHGDKGPNGSRGSTAGLAKLGLKISKAHDHTIAWVDDCVSMGNLIHSADYATGPTSWVGAWCLGHADGNRQLGLLVGDKYRA